jgi:hypothetical protein
MRASGVSIVVGVLAFYLSPDGSATLAQERSIVAVFDLEVKGIELDGGTVDRLTDYLGSLLASKGYQVVPRSQIKERLVAAKTDSYKDCYDQSCQIDIGKELAAQKSLASQVLKIGSNCKVAVNLFDLKRAASEGAGTASGACDEDGVVTSLERAVDVLFAREIAAPKPPVGAVKSDVVDEASKVQQPGSKLIWLRCPLGQSWTGSSCQGKAKGMDWGSAMKACPSGYRLPTRKELMDLLGNCASGSCASCVESARCSFMFGNDKGWYWSSSFSSDGSSVWMIPFSPGGRDVGPDGAWVRCLRDEP